MEEQDRYRISCRRRTTELGGKFIWFDFLTSIVWNPREINQIISIEDRMVYLARKTFAIREDAEAVIVEINDDKLVYPGPLEFRNRKTLFVERSQFSIWESFVKS